jgi:hypothetical protein
LAYNPDDGFVYTMTSGSFERYSIDGILDATPLSQPGVNIQGLTYIGGDQFLGIDDDQLYQYDAVADEWLDPIQLSQSLPNAGLAFDFGVLYAITSAFDDLFTIDLKNSYDVHSLGSHGGSNGGGLSTTCMSDNLRQSII